MNKPRFQFDNANDTKTNKDNERVSDAMKVNIEDVANCLAEHGPAEHDSKSEVIMGIYEDVKYDINVRLLAIFTAGSIIQQMTHEIKDVHAAVDGLLAILKKKKT